MCIAGAKLIILIPFWTTSFPTRGNFWWQLSQAGQLLQSKQYPKQGNCPKQGWAIAAKILLPCLGQLSPKILASQKRSGQKWYQNYQFCTSDGLEWILRIQIYEIHWKKCKKWPQKRFIQIWKRQHFDGTYGILHFITSIWSIVNMNSWARR